MDWKVMGTMVARFLECAVITHWLPHTPIQIFFCLVLVHKKVWCSLSFLNIQTEVLAQTFHITLIVITSYLATWLLLQYPL